MTDWICIAGGTLLVLLGIFETFLAVLHPRAVVGPLTGVVVRVHHVVCRVVLGHEGRLTFCCGPLLIVFQILCWATTLLLGVALIAWPHLGNGIMTSAHEMPDTNFLNAVYYAGFNLTTLGMGDLVPKTDSMRIVTITVSGLGFSFFTLVLAYVISIYSTLAGRNQFADEIAYRTARTGDTSAYLQSYFRSQNWELLYQDLFTLASKMAEMLESHHFYPALHYFRFNESRYAMTRMLGFCLEAATLLRAMEQHGVLPANIPAEPADRLWFASMQMLKDTKTHFLRDTAGTDKERHRLADHLAGLLQPLCDEAAVRRVEAGYRELAKQWDDDLKQLTEGGGKVQSLTSSAGDAGV
ncbi:potassium channel family protein [Roseimaritima sediminicola]|uniref:potassium channel family protein n=1 Tax=Roseimaritima sediminicola TaxID=2662066 RepID=UPI001F2A4395|nr:potassium channel family protein [Roseimaritima sediminicola]